MIKSINTTYLRSIPLLLFWGFGLVYMIFGEYLFTPNSLMFAFGGDALVIYYDVMYHTCHGSGTTLTAMNYPHGEYIFMTDAQGALSVTLQWINNNLFGICDYVLGIIHFLNIYLLFVGFILMYFVFERLSVHWLIAAIFSPLIVMLCPVIIRFGGHFGLSYPFLIPLTILWYLRKERVAAFELRDVLVAGILIFFTYNNPYIGMIAMLPLLIIGGLRVLFGGHFKWRKSMIIIGMALFCLALPYFNFKLVDTIFDRVDQQWGFFYFNTTLEGVLYPTGSLIRDYFISSNIKLEPTQFEKKQYLGLVTILLGLVGLIWISIKLFTKTISWSNRTKELAILALSGFLIFTFTSCYLWDHVNEDWMISHLGFLLMFKAMARLNWAFYFLTSILGIVVLNGLFARLKKLGYILILILSSLWVFDLHHYYVKEFKNSFHPNFLKKESQNQLIDLSSQYSLDTNHYQAMLVLPKMMAWTDLFLSNINYNSQHYSMKLSLATGMPLVSSMLSRMSISQSASAIQLLSHPWIKKGLAFELPNEKPLLLMLGKDHPPLEVGEKHLISLGDTIVDTEKFTLWKLPIDRLQNEAIRSELKTKSNTNQSIKEYVYMDFENAQLSDYFDAVGPSPLFGKGLAIINKGINLLCDTMIYHAGPKELSLWSYVDYHRYGLGSINIIIADSNNVEYINEYIDPRRGNDIDDLWIRTGYVWDSKPKSRIKVNYNADKLTFIDEFLIRDQNDTIYQIFDQSISANGYIINDL